MPYAMISGGNVAQENEAKQNTALAVNGTKNNTFIFTYGSICHYANIHYIHTLISAWDAYEMDT